MACTPPSSSSPTATPARTPAHDETVLRHRRGDPSKALAAAPQLVVAIPPQISMDDVRLWHWILGEAKLNDEGIAAAFEAYQQQNDALRSEALPAIFAGAIAAASPPEGWSADQAKDAARAIGKAWNKLLADEAVGDRALFEELARLSGGSIDPQELAALRNRDVARLYPDTLAAARADVGRMMRSLAASKAISEDSARIAAQIVRSGLLAGAAASTNQARATSELIAVGCLPELLQSVASSGKAVGAAELEGARARSRSALRNFAESSERMALQNRAAIDDIVAGVAEPDAKVVRRRFERDVYGALADPPLDGNSVLDLIPLVPDAGARPGIESLVQDWTASTERRQRDACEAYDAYQLRRIASPRRDRELWDRTASRIAELHAESERALLPIAALIIAAMPIEDGKNAQSKIDALIAGGRSTSEKQVDSIDPAFSRDRIDPKGAGFRAGKPVDIKATHPPAGTAP